MESDSWATQKDGFELVRDHRVCTDVHILNHTVPLGCIDFMMRSGSLHHLLGHCFASFLFQFLFYSSTPCPPNSASLQSEPTPLIAAINVDSLICKAISPNLHKVQFTSHAKYRSTIILYSAWKGAVEQSWGLVCLSLKTDLHQQTWISNLGHEVFKELCI